MESHQFRSKDLLHEMFIFMSNTTYIWFLHTSRLVQLVGTVPHQWIETVTLHLKHHLAAAQQ